MSSTFERVNNLNPPPQKSSVLVLFSPCLLLFLLIVWVIPWLLDRTDSSRSYIVVSWTSGALWAVILWWALHHLVLQVVSVFQSGHERHRPLRASVSKTPRFLVLYMTCDDFSEECCRSCNDQEYPADRFEVIICDDSSPNYRKQIEDFRVRHSSIGYIARENRVGFKAGNLNNALKHQPESSCDWVVIVDADQKLPTDYLSKLAPAVRDIPPNVGFVVTGRDPLSEETVREPEGNPFASPFQRIMAPEIRLFIDFDISVRGRFGFVPFLGHGGAVREAIWRDVGGFPLVVSEDFAFSLSARNPWISGSSASIGTVLGRISQRLPCARSALCQVRQRRCPTVPWPSASVYVWAGDGD